MVRRKPNANEKGCSRWLALLSNKVLPPFLFLVMSLFIIFVARSISSDTLRINLGILSVSSTAIGIYLLGA